MEKNKSKKIQELLSQNRNKNFFLRLLYFLKGILFHNHNFKH